VFTTFRLPLAALAVALAAGCSSSDGPKLYPVSGSITFENEPVKDGRITFRSGGPAGRSYSGEIKDGSYHLMAEPGEATVEIIASRIIPGKFDRSNGTPEPVGEMYIPAKYNSTSKLTAEVKTGSNDIPFELKK
jgi:hypothetical protein